eukprot:CAMPEP_0172183384 /NCGR_PEP_ID=MMETSP1050-20130122/18958_1 /TAXON_ID=233186 /ORGANISM="Cryptomonas curvata, Strain CCAP979/52" /LENGTH=468 /DNA_ID=CAMNT_0012857001 /DNA_START=82 /DNA_END=1488 /DNA_ORIENTATION=-
MTTYGTISRPSSSDFFRAARQRPMPAVEKTLLRPGSSILMRSARSSSSLDKCSDEKRDSLDQVRPASASAVLGNPSPPTYTMRVPKQISASAAYYLNRSPPSNASSRNDQSRSLPATPEKENGFVPSLHDGTFELKRPDSSCSDTIRRTVNSLQFANIADKLDSAADKAQRNNGWHLDEPELELVQVMAYMRQRAATSQIFVADFFRSFDLHRKGYICPENFYQALSDTGCFKDMALHEKDLILTAFSEKRPLNFRRHVFNHAAFSEVLQPCNDSRVRLEVGHVRVRAALEGVGRGVSNDSPCAVGVLTAKGEERLEEVLARLRFKIVTTRLSVRELIGDFDPHLNTTTVGRMKQQYKHTQFLCNVPGCISRSQYIRGMARLAGDIGLGPQDLDLLYSKYERNGAFNYYAFCRDMDLPVDGPLDSRVLSRPRSRPATSPSFLHRPAPVSGPDHARPNSSHSPPGPAWP